MGEFILSMALFSFLIWAWVVLACGSEGSQNDADWPESPTRRDPWAGFVYAPAKPRRLTDRRVNPRREELTLIITPASPTQSGSESPEGRT